MSDRGKIQLVIEQTLLFPKNQPLNKAKTARIHVSFYEMM